MTKKNSSISDQTDLLLSLLMQSRELINFFFDSIDPAQCQKVLDSFLRCKGFVIFTGVGKSGFIAEKIAATLISTGTKALYLPPTNFLHGDIGIVSEQDLIVFLSKSGESEELLDLVPFIRKRKAPIITWTSNADSRLAKMSSSHLLLPAQKELCPFNLVPTTSSELQLIFGNILSIALMKEKGFPLEQYAQNHPLGAIGKKMTLRVRDLMISGKDLPVCRKEQSLTEVLVDLSQKKCGVLLVVDEEFRLEGVFTDGDLRRALQRFGTQVLEQPISALMTTSAISIHPDTLAWDAMKILQGTTHKWVMTAPVVYEETLVGLLRMHDIVHAGLSAN